MCGGRCGKRCPFPDEDIWERYESDQVRFGNKDIAQRPDERCKGHRLKANGVEVGQGDLWEGWEAEHPRRTGG